MAKISINLLPPEIIAQELKKTRFYKIQFVGIGIILVMVFLTSLTLALRILQSRNIEVVQAKLSEGEQRVADLRDTQASLLLLKDRLTVITQYLGVPSKQSSLYKLIDKIIPPSVMVTAVSVNKTGDITFSALVPDPVNLDTLLDNLTNKDDNEDKLGQVSIESLSRGRDGIYRMSLKVASK
ncbi:MAG: hypothetical protein M1142_05200 [Patescibacteria group bacterium]|nr:hypothetical protein [Patescibacteria group bacterium]